MIYISLTTVPKRLNNWDIAEMNLVSLVTQVTAWDYTVILNIPHVYKQTGEKIVLPDGLLELEAQVNSVFDYSRLIINREDPDYGPILKVVGAFRYATNPDDIIIACDDDHVYHTRMVEYFMDYNERRVPILGMDDDSVLCYRGDMPVEKRFWCENEKCFYMLKPTHLYFPVLQERQLIVPGHWHGVMYRRDMFGDDFMDLLDKGDNDDILVGYYMKKNKIDVRCIPFPLEQDGRPVNDNGRPCFSFPIIENLPTEDSGFNEFRKKAGDGYGKTDSELLNYIHNNDIIFEL